MHQLRGRASKRRLPEAVRQRVVKLVKREYANFGPALAAEYPTTQHGVQVSKETLRQVLMAARVWKRRRVKEVHVWRARRHCPGTMNSQAEFKDVQVFSGSRVLYFSGFANGASEWRAFSGDWTAEGGVFRQTVPDARAFPTIGSSDWRDYNRHSEGPQDRGRWPGERILRAEGREAA